MNTNMSHNSFLLHKEDVEAILSSQPTLGKNICEPLKSIAQAQSLPFNVIELTEHTNKVEVHTYQNDLWFCLEGEVRFFCGGTMQEPHTRVRSDGTLDETEMRATSLEGAEEIMVNKGDWFWIPAGMPHQHVTEKTARLMIIKIAKV
ncbi:MAG: cupin domain-containing protein [bacterium]|nr:cupin domain-containing protein [bacterium]